MANASKTLNNLRKEKALPKEAILGFDANGRPIKKKKKIKKAPIIVFSVLAAILGFLYIPALIKTPETPKSDISKSFLNTEMIRVGGNYYKTYPDADFDGDGLTNSKELSYGTSGFNIDTDGDGLTDYIEIYTLNTSPLKFNNDLMSYVDEADKEKGESVDTPYKMNNVVLWPDNLYYKTYGGVIRTVDGYQFNNFCGWAQFAEPGYAYEYVDGIHKELLYSEEENAFYIDKTMKVVLFSQPMQKYYKLEMFGEIYYLDDEFLGQALGFILPDYGNYAFLKCYPVMECDRYGTDRKDTVIDIVTPEYKLPEDRFAYNQNDLETLARVRSSINEGKPVVASLYKENYGETLILVYGYTSEGDLIVANPETGEPIGEMLIYEKCGKYLTYDGFVQYREWFTFNCVGYRSSQNARVYFLLEKESSEEQNDEQNAEIEDNNGFDLGGFVITTTETPPAITENTTVETSLPTETTAQTENTVPITVSEALNPTIENEETSTTEATTTTPVEIVEVEIGTTTTTTSRLQDFDFAN